MEVHEEVRSGKLTFGEAQLVHEGKWLNYYNIPYKSDGKVDGVWEMCGRRPPKQEKLPYGGVIIIPIGIEPQTQEKMVLVEKIYRIPIQKFSLEFPAGMRDPHEDDPCATALRELKEETGYVGHNPRPFALVKSDPWKSNGTHCQIYVDVDLTLPENQDPQPNLEPEEDISAVWVKLKDLKTSLEKIAADEDLDLDQRLYSWALGIDFAQNMNSS
jgi:ADP-ribose pyrophosphatase